MLKKSNRLTSKQVLDIINGGKVINSPLFVLRYTLNNIDKRIGTVAMVKSVKTAVARNRARRRMYNILKKFFPSIIPGIHAIIFSRNDLNDYDFESLEKALNDLLVKGKLINIIK
jgi:ribonuclease P protein component